MSQLIEALYEGGVFKPLSKVSVKEHETVEIKILSKDQWQAAFHRVIQKIHGKSAQYSSDEIESDISQAIQETREEKHGG